MTDTDLSGARFGIERLREQLKKSALAIPDKNTSITIKFSAGVAALPPDGDPEAVIKDAFSALHAAKQAGRNCLKIAAISSQQKDE
jgi:PleD family two-component response regulator